MALTLLELRTKAADMSGRFDLADVEDSYADLGMDFFITSAQDFLDRRQDTPKATNTIYDEVVAGTWYYDFQRCRKVEEVWINNAEGMSQLDKKSPEELKELYPSLISETDQGTPLYYAIVPLKSTEATDIDSLGAFFNHFKSTDDTYNGIIILPPPDEAIVVQIKGLFYADILAAATDTNFWSNNYPDLFLMAIFYKLEAFNRNSEGMRDWLSAIDLELTQIDMNMVDEEVHEIIQIKD